MANELLVFIAGLVVGYPLYVVLRLFYYQARGQSSGLIFSRRTLLKAQLVIAYRYNYMPRALAANGVYNNLASIPGWIFHSILVKQAADVYFTPYCVMHRHRLFNNFRGSCESCALRQVIWHDLVHLGPSRTENPGASVSPVCFRSWIEDRKGVGFMGRYISLLDSRSISTLPGVKSVAQRNKTQEYLIPIIGGHMYLIRAEDNSKPQKYIDYWMTRLAPKLIPALDRIIEEIVKEVVGNVEIEGTGTAAATAPVNARC